MKRVRDETEEHGQEEKRKRHRPRHEAAWCKTRQTRRDSGRPRACIRSPVRATTTVVHMRTKAMADETTAAVSQGESSRCKGSWHALPYAAQRIGQKTTWTFQGFKSLQLRSQGACRLYCSQRLSGPSLSSTRKDRGIGFLQWLH